MKINWTSRYSDTMEDDEMGRWAIVGLVGDFRMGLTKPSVFELAWIKKLKDPRTHQFLDKFIVYPHFPYKGRSSFNSLEEAKESVQVWFDWFIKCSK